MSVRVALRPVIATLFALTLLVGGCSDEASDRCRDACERADQCADEVNDPNYKFDKGECTAACAFLEKDGKGQKLVESYVKCLGTAKSCAEVNACE